MSNSTCVNSAVHTAANVTRALEEALRTTAILGYEYSLVEDEESTSVASPLMSHNNSYVNLMSLATASNHNHNHLVNVNSSMGTSGTDPLLNSKGKTYIWCLKSWECTQKSGWGKKAEKYSFTHHLKGSTYLPTWMFLLMQVHSTEFLRSELGKCTLIFWQNRMEIETDCSLVHEGRLRPFFPVSASRFCDFNNWHPRCLCTTKASFPFPVTSTTAFVKSCRCCCNLAIADWLSPTSNMKHKSLFSKASMLRNSNGTGLWNKAKSFLHIHGSQFAQSFYADVESLHKLKKELYGDGIIAWKPSLMTQGETTVLGI